MTKERIEIIRQSLIPFVKKELLEINYEDLGKSDAKEFEKDLNEILDLANKALERDNEEIFKQFKTKAFYESEDILGTDMVDTYMITDYLADLLGVENEWV